jgi:FkbM family methyltransferase
MEEGVTEDREQQPRGGASAGRGWTAVLARLRLECSGAASRLGRTPLAGPLLRWMGYRLLPAGSLVWTQIEEGEARGLWTLVDARTGAELRRGNHEPAVQQALRRHLAPGNIFYDVGANFGFFSLVAARMVGPAGRLYAFEAEPDAAERLRQTFKRNGLGNTTVIEAAVWAKSGVVNFDRHLGSPDRMKGCVTEGTKGQGCVSVRAVALDDFIRSAPPPDVLKCDVEGAEVEVFAGAAELLSKHRPTIICEVHSAEGLRRLEQLFAAAGYQVSVLEEKATDPVHILAAAIP